MAQDLTIRIQAQNEALAELEKARQQIAALMQQVERGGARVQPVMRNATEGLSSVRRGMEMLAFQAAGVEGPVGRVAAGLLMFGTGSAIATGVVGVFGAIALAVKEIEAPLQAATDAMTKFAESMDHSRTPMQQYNQLLDDMMEKAGRAQGLTAAGLAASTGGLPGAQLISQLITRLTTGQMTAANTAAVAGADAAKVAMQQLGEQSARRWTNEYLRAVQAMDPAGRLSALMSVKGAFQAAGTDAAMAWGQAFKSETDRQLAEGLREYEDEKKFQRLHPLERGAPSRLTPVSRAALAAVGQGITLRGRPPGFAQYDTAYLPYLERQNGPIGGEPGQDWRAITSAAMAGIGALRGGGLSGGLSAAGGILSAIKGVNPLFGTALSGFSALTSLFHSSGGVRVRIMAYDEEALRQMRQVQGQPQAISYEITGSRNLRQTQYDLTRLGNRDGVVRIYG